MNTARTSLTYSRHPSIWFISLIVLFTLAFPFLEVWGLSPALALAIAAPVLSIGLWYLIFAPSYGVTFGKTLIKITSKKGAECVPFEKIAYLRLVTPSEHRPTAFVMRDGKEIELPDLVRRGDMDHLCSMAYQSGVPIRAV